MLKCAEFLIPYGNLWNPSITVKLRFGLTVDIGLCHQIPEKTFLVNDLMFL